MVETRFDRVPEEIPTALNQDRAIQRLAVDESTNANVNANANVLRENLDRGSNQGLERNRGRRAIVNQKAIVPANLDMFPDGSDHATSNPNRKLVGPRIRPTSKSIRRSN